MIRDLDVWRAATMLVKTHGAEAPLFAAQRADALLDRGDVAGQALWKRLATAAAELTRVAPAAGERLN
jgi:triphosphoribosyl-dephospho-CoA synthetase